AASPSATRLSQAKSVQWYSPAVLLPPSPTNPRQRPANRAGLSAALPGWQPGAWLEPLSGASCCCRGGTATAKQASCFVLFRLHTACCPACCRLPAHGAGLRDTPCTRCGRRRGVILPAPAGCHTIAQGALLPSLEKLQSFAGVERQASWGSLLEEAAQLGGAQYLEQLAAAAVDLAALADGIAAGGVKLWGLQGEIDRLNRELAALGAVNLAALEELTAARERKTFLDAQSADLTEAMKTLEDAIRRIDLETRELLQQTFAQVNEHFGRMFPSLFGGGSARLVMTGDEILDAGVQVMAQPPGKKNSTIHLLSGGEKALTAIALVFAIFQLNPAPFCLLDEVDAPLDDANTERYCKLVTEMSAGTQFLFISHNKIAMEMAEQLIGVTMQEQGVSRIVAVDMDEALGMAEAA
ncbi:MAG: hypothetical protein J0L89_09330, partial [Xanthomonadales bacterium]|nr:hypothetical protein [Xanthomonadales bacterium]